MTTYSYPQLVQLAQNAGFTGQNANTAAAIAMAESSGNPNSIAYNDGGKGYNSYGLMQINGVNDATVGGAQNALDPQTSFNQAYILSGGSNFSPWSTYNSGAYAQYLPSGGAMIGGSTGITINAPSSFAPSAPTNSPTDAFNLSSPAFGGTGAQYTALGASGGPATAGSVLNTGVIGGLAGAMPGTGINENIGLQPSTVSDITKWVTAPITAAEQWATTQFAQLGNWFTRGMLIILAIVIIMVALWRLSGSPNPAVMMEAAA